MQHIEIPGVGTVQIKKSNRAKRIIIAVSHDGTPRVTIPTYAPYLIGKRYALQHAEWLRAHRPEKQAIDLRSGMKIGKGHTLEFVEGDAYKSRVSAHEVRVFLPKGVETSHPDAQKEARKACTRAIRRQAELSLPGLLYALASSNGYSYKEVRCKALRTRWGSCSSAGIINLNIWLVQLPDELVEYVLAHELTHLNHQHHQSAFWQELEYMVPDYKKRRKELKNYQPTLRIEP